MKLIQDPIHGLLKIDDWIIKLIDTPEFQRLRRISQIGFANLVFPGANHTRFEHSLGVMHIARQLVESMDANEDERMEIVASALLHDIAHTPFSHCGESIVKRYLGITHENVEVILKRGVIRDILNELGLSIKKIAKHVKGESDCNIVKGDIDADRMDYLVRDSHYTGVAYGVFDVHRLINKIVFNGKRVVIDIGGLRSAESLLISRFMMYTTVYYHHVCRIARAMFEKALEYCIENEILNARDLLIMDDYDIVCFLRNQRNYAGEIMKMINERKLFKRALYVEVSRVGINIDRIDPKIAEMEIADKSGIDVKWIAVDIPKLGEGEEFKALVNVDGELKRLDEVSTLVSNLKLAERNNIRIGVYTKKEYVDRVRKVAVDYFAVDKTYQKTLF